MRTIIGGSRWIVGTAPVLTAITEAAARGITPTTVLSGMAAGPDTTGANWAIAQEIPLESFPAEWGKFGKRAGFLRNDAMTDKAEAVIAIWDGESRGTKMLIDLAEQKGLKIYIHRVQPRVREAVS